MPETKKPMHPLNLPPTGTNSGYGSEENYRFMEENGIEAYVKYNFFHKEQRALEMPLRGNSSISSKILSIIYVTMECSAKSTQDLSFARTLIR